MAEDETPNQEGNVGDESPGSEDAAQVADNLDQAADAGGTPAETQGEGLGESFAPDADEGMSQIAQDLNAVSIIESSTCGAITFMST